MASIEEARSRWQEIQGQFEKKRDTRVAYLGNGLGFAASNIIVGANPAYVWAREALSDRNSFPVLNRGAVRPSHNLPVVLGFREYEPDFEQILDVHWAAFDQQTNASVLAGIGPHHEQHEFGGGDEVFIDARLFKPGLIKPTVPLSMKVKVLSFNYYYGKWRRFPETESIDFTSYLPVEDNIFVLLSIDPESNTLTYTQGEPFSTTTWDSALPSSYEGLANIPLPPGDNIPVGAVLLDANTNQMNWNSATVNNIRDTRLHITAPQKRVLDRLEQIEGFLGNNTDLPCTGAAGFSTDEFIDVVDGGIF